MIKPTKIWPILLLGITIVALILLSAGLSNLELQSGQPFPFGGLSGTQGNDTSGGGPSSWSIFLTSWWGILSLGILLILFVLWLIVFIFRPEARKRMLSRLLSYAILLLLVSVMLFTLQQQIDPMRLEENQPQEVAPAEMGEAGEEDAPAPPAFVIEPPQWLTFTITTGVFTLLLGVTWFLWNRRRRRNVVVESLAREADQAVRALQAGQDLKNTVMNCYLKMTRLLSQQQDIHREKAMTPREFENYLAGAGLNTEHIRRLTDLFEKVRYSPNVASSQEEQEAVACLRAIADTYGSSTV